MLLLSKQLAGLHYMFSMFTFSHIYVLSATINHREGDIKGKTYQLKQLAYAWTRQRC